MASAIVEPTRSGLMNVVCFADKGLALQLLDEPETLRNLARGVLAASVAVSHAVAKEAGDPDSDHTRLTDLIAGMELLSGLALAMQDEISHQEARS